MLHSFFIMKNDGHKVINLLLIAMLAGGSLFTDINIAEAKVGASMQGFVLSGAYPWSVINRPAPVLSATEPWVLTRKVLAYRH